LSKMIDCVYNLKEFQKIRWWFLKETESETCWAGLPHRRHGNIYPSTCAIPAAHAFLIVCAPFGSTWPTSS
jgi:hypothetical protein